MRLERYRQFLGLRQEERERRSRLRRLVASGLVPVPDEPLELPSEWIDVATGRLFDRRRRARSR